MKSSELQTVELRGILKAFSLAQGKVGLFCGHVVGFDGGEHGEPDSVGGIVPKPEPDTLSRYRRLQRLKLYHYVFTRSGPSAAVPSALISAFYLFIAVA